MFDNILVPLDGSRLAECVLPHVIAVASAFGASVTLLHVLDTNHREDGVTDPIQWQLRKVESQAYIDTVASALEKADLSAERVVVEGPAAQRIRHAVREREIDLLILSSHGQSGLAQWNVSGVVEKVIQNAPTSLLLVRAYQERPGEGALRAGYQRIMLPLDGSKRAECVLTPAEILARHWNSELLLTHVIRQPRLFGTTPVNAEDRALLGQVVSRLREQATHYFQQLQQRLPVQTDVRLLLAENIAATLNDLVGHEKVDLVLLSAHGHGCSSFQRYGSLVSCWIFYGSAPLLILQDLPAEQIEATAAERAMHTLEAEEDIRRPSGTGHGPL